MSEIWQFVDTVWLGIIAILSIVICGILSRIADSLEDWEEDDE